MQTNAPFWDSLVFDGIDDVDVEAVTALGRPILDSPLVRGALWLRWTRHDGIRTFHHGVGLARGWTERGGDGPDGWVALRGPARPRRCTG
ncbi:hypothetical protein [Kitasatospora sp. NPDC094011]|uniref:hypothetical protein n=1 Tax=Kitasatospora sp. NPDC094011 TaxID=3364090 RepID=UPI0038275EB3